MKRFTYASKRLHGRLRARGGSLCGKGRPPAGASSLTRHGYAMLLRRGEAWCLVMKAKHKKKGRR